MTKESGQRIDPREARLDELLSRAPLRERDRALLQETIWEYHSPSTFNRLYQRYLASEYWRNFRQQVIQKLGDLCEFCINTPGTELHHISYDRLGAELATDVVFLCRQCHVDEHPSNDEVSWRIAMEDRRARGLANWLGPNEAVYPRRRRTRRGW